MKKLQIRFHHEPKNAVTYTVKSVEYNSLGLVRLEHPNGDLEYINFREIFSVKELA